MTVKYQDIIDYWFNELTPEQWFMGGEVVDQQIAERFSQVTEQAKRGELYSWRESLEGRVAEIIVLDQFSRNLYRKDGRAYSSDDMALTLSQEIQRQDGFDDLDKDYQLFAIMPFMHAESRLIQNISVELFKKYDEWDGNLEHAVAHKEIIDQFGRYPSRNKQIGRESTPEELTFLSESDYLQ
ncbi:DUF924 domain-containing protein [Aerococcaceae bacterium DSM 111022]|nr:DUF924 domain-containing protein [Aerococcaceae bacterium DSM 111022]